MVKQKKPSSRSGTGPFTTEACRRIEAVMTRSSEFSLRKEKTRPLNQVATKSEADLPTAKAAQPAERPPSGLSVPSDEEKHNKTASALARTIGEKSAQKILRM